MLVLKIELEQNKENYQAVLKALEEFDILSASWEDASAKPKVVVTGKTDDGDMAAKLSAALDRSHRRNYDN
jgi:hypothetical protein